MSLRPFLCHARADRERLEAFSAALSIAGADGWQDVNDLYLGRPNKREIRRVIHEEAGGFIWFGTQKSIDSRFIREVEVPAALARARREPFPVVPLFSDIRPSQLPAPRVRWPRWRHSLTEVGDHNGVLRESGESDVDFWERSAAAYVRHAVLTRGSSPASVSFGSVGAPDRSAELTVDWRALVSHDSSITPRAVERAVASASNLRQALEQAGVSRVKISGDLYLPFAVLVGLELGSLSRLSLEITQRQGALSLIVATEMIGSQHPAEIDHRVRRGSGPVLVVVSTPDPVEGAATRYADQIDAQELISLHIPRLLDPTEIGGLANQVSSLLARISDQGREKHLIIRGPMSLAMLIGAAGNPIGRTCVPLWDRTNGYRPGPVLGGAIASLQPSF